jgi:hypothetical protein
MATVIPSKDETSLQYVLDGLKLDFDSEERQERLASFILYILST